MELYNSQQFNESIEEYKKAAGIVEDHVYYWNIFLSHYNLDEYKEAKRFLTKAIELKTDPKYLEALEDPNLP